MAQTITQDDLGQDNTNQANQQNNQAGGGQQNSNQSGQGQGGGSQAPTVTSYNPNQQKGSGYTNIQRIVQANQGNRLGQAVGGGIQQAGQQVQNNLNTSQQQFQQQQGQNQANTAGNQQLVSNVLNNADQYVADNGNAQNAQQGARFQQLISGQYTGPMQLQNAQQLQSQAGNVNQLNQGLSSAGGRVGLLQQFVGNPQYNQGQQTLDALLLGQGNNAQALAQARQATAGLGNKVQGAVAGAQAQGQEQSNLANQFGQQVQGQFGQKVSDMNTGLASQAAKAQTDRDSMYQKTLQDLQSGNITQKEADLLGLSNGTQVTKNLLQNIGQYVSEDPTKASAQNIASAQDYARLNALRSLSGQNAPQAAQDILGQYANQDSQADVFKNAQAIKADQAGLHSANNAQVQQYHAQLDPVQGGRDQAQDIVNMTQQRDRALQSGDQMGALRIQAQIGQKYPGAANNGWTRSDWAQGLLNSAQQKYQDTLNSVNAAYGGGLQSLNVTPDDSGDQSGS